MISLIDVHKAFGAQKVLNGLNLEIPEGKITVIIGRSGEGKSVMLKHLLGLIRPDSGKVLVDDQDIFTLSDYDLNETRKKFGMLFQNAALFDSMTVFENIAFPLVEHTKKTKTEIQKDVENLINIVGLKPNTIDKFPSELSGGMRKRVGLARAISLKPKNLLYDEPTTGLDPIMTDVIDHLILNTQRKLGITSVVISHDIKGAFAIADKIAMLHEGKILLEGPPSVFENTTIPYVRSFLEGKASAEQLGQL